MRNAMHKYSAFFAVPEAMFVRFVNAGRRAGGKEM